MRALCSVFPGRRSLLRQLPVLCAAAAGLQIAAAGLRLPGSGGAGNRAAEGAAAVSWRAVVAPEAEPGEPLIVAGRVFASDGRTPKEGMTVHVYQTDASGRYDRPGSGSAAPRLSATVTTDAAGRYEFRTIRPGAYPEGRWPAHIHFKVSGPGYKERYVSDLVFADDPRVPAAERESSAAAGRFAFVCTPSRGEDGVLRCERNIRLD